MLFTIPEKVSHIIHTLNQAGFEAYAVGGCVRDTLLGRTPGDWDITTSALPAQVKKLFRRTVDTGIKHGTVTVMIKDEHFEVTTFRIDGAYQDGRHPEEVTFTANLADDLMRRDFTVNAMAYHPEKGIVDLWHGMDDLRAGIIRAVGNPDERFEEDALRIMRAIRFAGQLNFKIDPETQAAIRRHAPRLALVSNERIQVEMTKLLCSPHPEKFLLFYETGITKQIFPLFDEMMTLEQNNPYHCYTVGLHTMKMVELIDPDPILRWTALLHDSGKTRTHTRDGEGMDHFYGHGAYSAQIAEDYLKELRFDNDTIAKVVRLVRYHDYRFNMTKKNLRKAIHLVTPELFPMMMSVIRADNLAKSPMAIEQILPAIDQLAVMYEEILADEDCLTLKDLAVNGGDLIAAGMKPGPAMGRVLSEMLELVLEDPAKNKKQYLLNLFQNMIRNPD